jgi:hypothetical protein
MMDETPATLLLAFHIRQSRLGRRRLAEQTGLTEMTVRVALERLRERRLVRLGRTGVELTPSGLRRFGPLLESIHAVAAPTLTSLRLDDIAAAARLATLPIGAVWAVRDAAVREGATGLLLLRYDPDGWTFAHDDEPVALHNPGDAEELVKHFPDAENGDLLVIAFGADQRGATLGLWGALPHLLRAAP